MRDKYSIINELTAIADVLDEEPNMTPIADRITRIATVLTEADYLPSNYSIETMLKEYGAEVPGDN